MAIHDQTIIEHLSREADPLVAAGKFHFHGTANDFAGLAPRAGGVDGVFWTAESPAVAQTYLARSPSRFFNIDNFFARERVSPHKNDTGIIVLRAMGFKEEDFDVTYRTGDRIQSFRVPAGHPTYAEAKEWLEKEMGYVPVRKGVTENLYRLNIDYAADGKELLKAADHRGPGQLLLVEKNQNLRWLDFTEGRDIGDLTEPDHLRFKWFEYARERGFDGLIINDYCQSEAHGNVPHKSWGLLPETGLKKVRYAVIPATNFDWPAEDCPGTPMTPDFLRAHEKIRAAARKTQKMTLSMSS